MERIIIGIHGLGNKPSANRMYKWWLNSIYEGLSVIGHPRRRLLFEMVYWADILHPVAQDPSVHDPKDGRYLDDPYQPSSRLKGEKPSMVRRALLDLFEKQLKRLHLDKDGAIIWKQLSDLVIRRYFEDLDSYYSNCLKPTVDGPVPVRDRIRERLAAALRKHQDKEIFLIAHSMGSIVAYDVLSLVVPHLPIHTLVTIGSPLGVPVVINKICRELESKATQPPTPDNIRHAWYNLADLEDKVAFHYKLLDDYTPNQYRIAPIDVQVTNDYEINGHRNPHKDYGYLRTPELAEVCFAFLSQGADPATLVWQDRIYKSYERLLYWWRKAASRR